MTSLFITGSSGFIGSRLVRAIDGSRFESIYCLSRTPAETPLSEPFRFIEGNLMDVDSYRRYLRSCDSVVHLAAVTGKAAFRDYFDTNVRGTELLIEECRRNDIKNFLYFSTISVKFRDKQTYYYAQSKELGEQVVRNSGLNYIIVRPTIVIGPGARIWRTLSGLARKPILLMPGDGRTRIQPIYVEDLVQCLLTILYQNLFVNETVELGGPEGISFERLLRRIHYFYYGKEPSVIHLPLRPITALLSLIEMRGFSKLPMNSGQLSAFSNDGTIEPNHIFNKSAPKMKSVDGMLRQVISNE